MNNISYIGPAGAGLGFTLSGMNVHECSHADEALEVLRTIKQKGSSTIVFMDELLAEQHLEAIEKMNQDPIPTIILLPNPSNPRNVSAKRLQQLMVRAVGSDIGTS